MKTVLWAIKKEMLKNYQPVINRLSQTARDALNANLQDGTAINVPKQSGGGKGKIKTVKKARWNSKRTLRISRKNNGFGIIKKNPIAPC